MDDLKYFPQMEIPNYGRMQPLVLRNKMKDIVTLIYLFSFLFLLPGEAKSSAELGDNGYDSYLRDAHRQVRGSVKILAASVRKLIYWTRACDVTTHTFVEFRHFGWQIKNSQLSK